MGQRRFADKRQCERRQFSAISSPRRAVLVICGSAMGDKVSHDEISARGGRSRSEAKLEAVARNLAKKREVLNARRAARTQSEDQSADNCRRPGNDYPAGPPLTL
jgi:hypothetical protein